MQDHESNTSTLTFVTETEAIEFLARQIRNHTGDCLATEFAMGLVPVFRVESDSGQARAANRQLVIRKFRWVIRDDDLQLASSICDGLQAAAGVAFFTAARPTVSETASALTGVLVALFQIIRQVVRKGARLEPISFAVLAALHNSKDGQTAEALAARLNANVSPSSQWTEEVLFELRRLERVALTDGSVISLTNMDADGRWYVAGI